MRLQENDPEQGAVMLIEVAHFLNSIVSQNVFNYLYSTFSN